MERMTRKTGRVAHDEFSNARQYGEEKRVRTRTKDDDAIEHLDRHLKENVNVKGFHSAWPSLSQYYILQQEKNER